MDASTSDPSPNRSPARTYVRTPFLVGPDFPRPSSPALASLQELADLTAFAKANGFVDETLSLWDVPFWSERQSESKFGFEEEELRPYFALPNVLDGLFSLCARMFDVRIVESAEPVSKWHPDVKYFDVLDGQVPLLPLSFDCTAGSTRKWHKLSLTARSDQAWRLSLFLGRRAAA